MSLPHTVHLELLLTPDLGGFCLFSYAPRQPVLQNSWKDSLESTCATMVPFMLVMSLGKTTGLITTSMICGHLSGPLVTPTDPYRPLPTPRAPATDSLFTHGAALLWGGLVRKGREAIGGAEEMSGAFALVGCLAFLQGLLAVCTGHLGLKQANTWRDSVSSVEAKQEVSTFDLNGVISFCALDC